MDTSLDRPARLLLLENVGVLPAAQGRGIGARLLALAEEYARGLGLGEIGLYIKRSHEREPRLLRPAWICGDPQGQARRLPPGVLP